MNIIENKTFDEERALYGSRNIIARNCAFDGEADGESAFKESENIVAEKCFFNLRYPFWHDNGVKITSSEMTELCRAALWYSKDIEITDTKMHGIKALRECENVYLKDCDVVSQEFGWSIDKMKAENCKFVSEYFMMRSNQLNFYRTELLGKYSFQYIKDSTFEECTFNTKDAFWHSENVIVKNSTIKGEYLAWYSKGLTLINCRIIGTQPFCYCEDLKLLNCEMIDADLCFEKSSVNATVTTPVISIKNARSGKIELPALDELIMDDENAKCEIFIK